MNTNEILNLLTKVSDALFYGIYDNDTKGIPLGTLQAFSDKIDSIIDEWQDIIGVAK